MQYSKNSIIAEYNRLREHLGESPTSRIFGRETGINLKVLEKFFGRNSWAKLVTECGDTPKKFSSEKTDLEDILVQWAELVRKTGQLPAYADWRYYNCKPTINNIKSSYGLNWLDIPYKFLELYFDKEEWKDVIAFIPSRSQEDKISYRTIPEIEGVNFELLKFIPPVVQELISTSTNEEKARKFEADVNLAFQMLGFEVDEYGQGTSRKPDGVAKENQFRYAILIDSKARKENYKFGTEDRKFIEYMKSFAEPLRKNGYAKIYFLIVSSRFDNVSEVSIKNIRLETQVTTSLLSSRLLLKLLANKIKSPRLFDLNTFQELLIHDGIITEKRVDQFLLSQKH